MPPLHDYQQALVDFALDRFYVKGEQGAGLFVAPGLGKTRVTLSVIKTLVELGEVKRVLIIAPLRVGRLVWPQEIEKWGFDLPFNQLCSWGRDSLPTAGVIDIINYESLHRVTAAAGRYCMVVCDESTKVKSWKAKRSKALRKMLPDIKRRLILTGTPTANSLTDLFSQVFVLDGGRALGRNITVFHARFCCRGGWQGRQWVLRKEAEQELLAAVAPLVIRLDESVLDMPELIVQDILCELPAAVRPQYKRLKRELLAELEAGDVFAVNSAAAYIKMRQFSNGAVYNEEKEVVHVHDEKLEALKDLVEELGSANLLLLYQFKHDLSRIKQEFPYAAVLESKGSEDLVAAWNRGEVKMLLAQCQSTSHGLNLQGAANHVAYFGLGDSPEVYEQAYRRVWRAGQKESTVIVHRLLTKDTVDQIIRDRVSGKLQNQKDFLDALKKHARSK